MLVIILSFLPKGDADLATALDYVRVNSFTSARPEVPKAVIAIIHQMPRRGSQLQKIVEAGRRLTDSCVSLVAMVVDHETIDYTTVKNTVSREYFDHYYGFRTYADLDNAGRSTFNCPNNTG